MKKREIVNLESIWNFLKSFVEIMASQEHCCTRCNADLTKRTHQEHCVYSDVDFEFGSVLSGNKSFKFQAAFDFRLTIF